MLKKTNIKIVHQEKELEYITVTEKISVFRYTIKSTTEFSGKSKQGKNVKEGFTTDKSLKKYLDGKYSEPRTETNIFYFSDEQLEQLRTSGWEVIYSEESSQLNFSPYTEIEKIDSIPRDNIVRLDDSSNMVFNLNGEPLPVAIQFDYISGRISNRDYHLDKVVEILKARNDIKFPAEEPIYQIPYYNQEDGYTHGISFTWMPNKEDYQNMWKKCLSYKTKYPSCDMYQAIFDLDLLGLRAGKATKYDEFAGYYSTKYNQKN